MDIRQNTATTVWIGPFKSTDGITSSTGSTAIYLIAQNNGDFVATTGVNAQSTGVVAWFKCPLTAANVNFLGILTIAAQSSSAYLDVWAQPNVVTANYWDTRYGTDEFQVDVVQVVGSTSDADDLGTLNDLSTTDILTQVNASTGANVNVIEIVGSTSDADDLGTLNDLSTTDILTQVNASTGADVNLIEIIGSTSAVDELLNMFDGTGYAGGAIRLQSDWVETNGDTEIDTGLTPATWTKEIYSKLINDSYKDSNEYKFYSSTGAYLFSIDIATTSRTRSS